MSASLLIVIVIAELSHRGPRIAGFHGVAPLPQGVTKLAVRTLEPSRLTTDPQHLARFEGGNALPGFRAAALLARLQGARRPHRGDRGAPRALGLERRAARRAPNADRLAALLRYGDAGRGRPTASETIVVAPRLGTISPWASKATDIARNCGLVVHRIERVTEYALALEEAAHRPRRAARRRRARRRRGAAARPHDRVRVLRSRRGARSCSTSSRRAPSVAIDVLGGGRAALDGGEPRLRPGALGRRDRLPARRLPRARPQPERRRADDVRAGQQRALPAQDLQRELHDRRRARRSARCSR